MQKWRLRRLRARSGTPGYIIFSQYFDSVWWLANLLSEELPDEIVGIYAGSGKSGVIHRGEFTGKDRDDIKGGREWNHPAAVSFGASSFGAIQKNIGAVPLFVVFDAPVRDLAVNSVVHLTLRFSNFLADFGTASDYVQRSPGKERSD